MADLALLDEFLEGRHDLFQHAFDGETAARGTADDGVVKLVEIDPFELKPGEAGVQRGGDASGDLARLGRRQPHLGAEIDVGLQLLEHAPEILFRAAVAVLRGGVEIIDIELERARHRAFLVGRRAAYHQSADRAAAETQERHIEPGLAEPAFFHALLLRFCQAIKSSDFDACQSAASLAVSGRAAWNFRAPRACGRRIVAVKSGRGGWLSGR